MVPEVEYTRSQDCVGTPVHQACVEVRERTGTTRRNDWYGYTGSNRAEELDVVACIGTIRIHAVDNQLTCAELCTTDRPGDRIETGRTGVCPCMGKHLPGWWIAGYRCTAGIDRQDDTLTAVAFRAVVDELWVEHRGSVDRNLVCAGPEHAIHVIDGADAAANRQRDKHLRGCAFDHLDHYVAIIGTRGDVIEDEFISAAIVVKGCQDHRVARVAMVEERYPFDDPTCFDVETRDDATFEHS